MNSIRLSSNSWDCEREIALFQSMNPGIFNKLFIFSARKIFI